MDACESTAAHLEAIRMLLEHQAGVSVEYNEFCDPYTGVNERSA
jgi:hypothetical protein